jgi:hypothetical protein
VEISEGQLGCSVVELYDVDDCLIDAGDVGGWSNGEWKQSNVLTVKGLADLKRRLREDRVGGIAVWADTSVTDARYKKDATEHDVSRSHCSGKLFYEFLKSRGEHVQKSASYKNPGHQGVCTLYYWYFRKRAVRLATAGPAKATGRKKVVSKAQAIAEGLAA